MTLENRIRAACCSESGLSDDALEAHIRAIVLHILALKGQRA